MSGNHRGLKEDYSLAINDEGRNVRLLMEELKIVGFGSKVAAEDSRLYTMSCQAQGHTSLPCVACKSDAHSLLFFIMCRIEKSCDPWHHEWFIWPIGCILPLTHKFKLQALLTRSGYS